MVDLDAPIEAMATEDLLAYQQEVTRLRLDALAAGRRAQAEIDRRAAERAEQRAAEDEALGAVRKPAPQQVFGETTPAAEVPDAEPDRAPSGVLRKGGR